MASGGFDALHPGVQHHIVNTLGWPSLRPLQEQSVAPIYAGHNLLAIAPTAGGKTEAAVFPLLSRIVNEGWQGLSVLYVCPLRALLNNLHPRLERYAGFVGLRAGLWHGDVSGAARNRMMDDPPEVLLTTPESIEAILMSTRRDHAAFFAGLQAVVVDEIHAFGGDDRGWHLLAVLERLGAIAGRDIQRIGLSATVGEPDRLATWLAGSSKRVTEVLAPPVDAASPDPEITLDHVGTVPNAAKVIASLHRGEKRLVFADSRRRVEELAVELRGLGVTTYVSHSSLALDERRRAEEAFAQATDCVIVATSTLELGIDVGDLDRVIQLDSPPTVAGFLQRLGRTGRRPSTTRNMLFLTIRSGLPTAVAAALLHLWRQGYVEPVAGPPRPYHLLAQQVLASVLQDGSIGRNRWDDVIGRVPVFADAIADGVGERIVDHLVTSQMLFDDGSGLLGIGTTGEDTYGRRHFLDLTSAFTAPPLFVARHGHNEIGYLDPVSLLTNDRGFARVLLAGRTWQITSIDWDRHFVWVEPTDSPGRSQWVSDGQPMSAELCNAVRDVLAGIDPAGVHLTGRAEADLAATRASFSWAQRGRTAVVRSDDDGSVTWWTFGGLHANAGLMTRLGPMLGGQRVDNFAIPLAKGTTSEDVWMFTATVDPDADVPSWSVDEVAKGLKFADCLPAEIARRVADARLADPSGIAAVVEAPIDSITVV